MLESTRDITESRTSEQRQRLLMGELTHRVRNILAVIQAIARHTLRSSPAKEDFVERFEGRLAALAGAHTLLVQSDWRGADLGDLAHQQLEAYIAENPDRLRIQGEPILLPADIATPFGLVLHELATNAAKYGALTNSVGSVAVTWTVSAGNNPRRLRFVWKETNGPAPNRPASRGFGTTLIESAIPGAQVQRAFEPDGFTCTIELPVPESGEHAAAAEV